MMKKLVILSLFVAMLAVACTGTHHAKRSKQDLQTVQQHARSLVVGKDNVADTVAVERLCAVVRPYRAIVTRYRQGDIPVPAQADVLEGLQKQLLNVPTNIDFYAESLLSHQMYNWTLYARAYARAGKPIKVDADTWRLFDLSIAHLPRCA